MKQENEWFIIDDVDQFIESTRVLVFNAFGKTEETQLDELSFVITSLDKHEIDELNKTLTQEECSIISKDYIKTETNKKTKKVRFVISTEKYMAMIESFNSRMVSNMLNHLTNIGVLESAYDSKSNDFIFWVKENDVKKKKSKENPETD
jgi:uncharacterized membrane protein YgaE (UPF0421/DUF939 family)